MKNKTRVFLIGIVVLILLIIGFVIYYRYSKTTIKEEKVVVNNYYSSEFLFNNNYIRVADSINDAKNINKDLDIHVTDNTLYVNLLSRSSKIKNVPEKYTNIYFDHLDNDCYEFSILNKNDLYYASTCLNSRNEVSFEKISSIAKSVYVPNTYKNGIYINDSKPTSNFIIDTTLKELKYITYKENVIGLYNNLKDEKPYFDYVCASDNISVCKNLMVYVTFSKEVLINDNSEFIKDKNNRKLLAEDLFGSLVIDSDDKIDIDSLNYEDLSKYNYHFEVYVLTKNNYIYKIDINKDSVKDSNLTKAEKLTNKKIKIVDYKKDKLGVISRVVLTDIDGGTINVGRNKNEKIMTSTIYDRQSLIDSLKK